MTARLLSVSFSLRSYENFIENPTALYPAGSATMPDLHTFIYVDSLGQVQGDELTLIAAIELN